MKKMVVEKTYEDLTNKKGQPIRQRCLPQHSFANRLPKKAKEHDNIDCPYLPF